jgi:small GTP-binding protein
MNTHSHTNEPRFLLKTLLVGDTGVGKSSLLERLVYPLKDFNKEISTTIGMEFATHQVHVAHHDDNDLHSSHSPSRNGERCVYKLQIWDCAGQPKFYSIVKSYFRGAHIVVFVFDITRKESFHNLLEWNREVVKNITNDYVTVVIGNKCDLASSRQVTTREAQEFANSISGTYIETSAKDFVKIHQMFQSPVDKIDDLYHKQLFTLEKNQKRFKNNIY